MNDKGEKHEENVSLFSLLLHIDYVPVRFKVKVN